VQVGQEIRRARTELRAEVGSLAIQIAERLVRKSLRDEDHQRLVSEALARIEPA
jgi:F0F1-type ATP synthase membrane subunit b/b'